MTRSTARDLALCYLRRSTGRQEASLGQQLDWAIAEAARQGARLAATQADLAYMLAHRLN